MGSETTHPHQYPLFAGSLIESGIDVTKIIKSSPAVIHEDFKRSRSETVMTAVVENGQNKSIICGHHEDFKRSRSESIMTAVAEIDNDPLLIADGSKRYLLPLVSEGGTNTTDLKEISAETLVTLLKGVYDQELKGYDIVDCRYPFEFNGGHIQGAINLHTQKQVYERYLQRKGPISTIGALDKKRFILIFHCEFSSKRGPDMCRFLRGADRNINTFAYPLVHYPEVYILFGGYKQFFLNYQEYCTPRAYIPMIEPLYAEEHRIYKAQARNEVIKGSSITSSLKRSRSTNYDKGSLKKLYH